MREQSEVKHKITLNTLALSDRVLADVLLQLLRDRVHGGGRNGGVVAEGVPGRVVNVERGVGHRADAHVDERCEEEEATVCEVAWCERATSTLC